MELQKLLKVSFHLSPRRANKDLIYTINCILFISLLFASEVSGKLTLSKQCGEIVCKAHYYCARVDDSCRPCQETCDRALSNYDQDLCEKDCQDYLHDLFYMRKGLHNHSEYDDQKIEIYYSDIQEELRMLKVLLMVAIIMSTIVMLAIFGLFIYMKRSKNRLGISNPSWCGGKGDDIMDLPVIYSNSKCVTLPRKPSETVSSLNNANNNASRISTPDLVSRSEGNVCVLSVNKFAYADSIKKPQKMRREPSESTLPEYQGYDNPAMAPSPTHM